MLCCCQWYTWMCLLQRYEGVALRLTLSCSAPCVVFRAGSEAVTAQKGCPAACSRVSHEWFGQMLFSSCVRVLIGVW